MKKRSKKWIILLLLAIMIVIVLGIILWFRTESQSSPLAAVISSPKPTPFPKVEKFEVPILMYHYIRVAPADDTLGQNLSVTPENFAAHLKYLYDDNYRTIKLVDLADPDRQEISRVYFEKKKPIVLTFDDGYEDAYTAAFPALKKYEFIGTFFIIKDYVGRENHLNDEQIAKMKTAGMEFGSHTLSHPDLTKINLDEAKQQIFDSKGDWSVFCYPAGRYNNEVVNLIKEAGYTAAVTTKIGITRENSNLLELRRVRVENVSPQELMDKISYAYEYGSD